MLDIVAIAMVIIVLVMALSIHLVRNRKNFAVHKKIQIATTAFLAVMIVAFEIDMRFLTNWRESARVSPYYATGWVDRFLMIHLLFAIPTPFVWGAVIWSAMKRFKQSFQQGDYNCKHRLYGRIAAVMMLMTAVTGWIFYYMAFVA